MNNFLSAIGTPSVNKLKGWIDHTNLLHQLHGFHPTHHSNLELIPPALVSWWCHGLVTKSPHGMAVHPTWHNSKNVRISHYRIFCLYSVTAAVSSEPNHLKVQNSATYGKPVDKGRRCSAINWDIPHILLAIMWTLANICSCSILRMRGCHAHSWRKWC
jgi:hypothetical protein